MKRIEQMFRKMGWEIPGKDALGPDDLFIATWDNKAVEITRDGVVILIDMFRQRTNKKDEHGDWIYKDTIKKHTIKSYEELRNLLAREDFITTSIADYIKSKRERQVFFLHHIEKLERKAIQNILNIDNINLNSIIYRLNRRLEGVRKLYSILEEGKILPEA